MFNFGVRAYRESLHCCKGTKLVLPYLGILSPVYTTEFFWHGSGEVGTDPKKKRFGLDKICSVNNLSVPNFIRAETKFLPVLGPSAR